MSNAIIAWVNQIDGASLTANSASATLPVNNLQTPHIAKVWRATSNSAQLIADFGTSVTIGVVGLFGTNLSASGTMRVRLGASSGAGDIYDSGTLSSFIDPDFDTALHILSTQQNARYLTVDIADNGLSYVQAGRWVAAPYVQPGVGVSFGLERGYVDDCRRTKSRGGQTYVDPGAPYRFVRFSFDALTASEALDFAFEMDRAVGMRTDVLFVIDPASTNLGRDSLWGLMAELSPVAYPEFGVYTKSYRIEERL